MSRKIVGSERYGSTSVSNSYVLLPDGKKLETVSERNNTFLSVSQFFRSVFLPQGYPESVSDDYLEYQIWDTIQAFSSSITGSLATQAVLKGVGVGDESATVLAATITWLMKDGMGMVGRILFAWVQGSYLDCDCKRWRLFADVLNDCSIFLDILAPIFNNYFRVFVCMAGVCKSIVGVAGGATRAALTQHQARRNNMADVSAKDGSQETLVNLFALICSLILMPLVSGQQNLIWCLFISGTILHLFANYQAVVSVTMETFNQARLHIVVQDMLARSSTGRILGVKEANQLEPVLWKTRRKFNINLGCSLQKLSTINTNLTSLLSIYRNSRYLLAFNLQQGEINILLRTEADWLDQLRSCYHAEVIEYSFRLAAQKNVATNENSILANTVLACKQMDMLAVISNSLQYVEMTWRSFIKTVEEARWKTTPVQLCADEWRAEWDLQGLDVKHYQSKLTI